MSGPAATVLPSGLVRKLLTSFLALLSRPHGVVRTRWRICGRSWSGYGDGCRSLRSRWTLQSEPVNISLSQGVRGRV